MVIVPALLGATVGGWSPLHIAPLLTWLLGYHLFYATSRLVKGRMRPRFRPPVYVYTALTAIAGVITLTTLGLGVLNWLPLFLPFMILAVWQMLANRERSILARASTIMAGTLMMPLAFDIGFFARFGEFTYDWGIPEAWYSLHAVISVAISEGVIFDPVVSSAAAWLPNSTNLNDWAWVWVAALGTAAYFFSTVPYVKTLVRNKGDERYLVFSIGLHIVLTLFAAAFAVLGWVHWLMPAVWVALTIKSIAVPWYAKTHQKTVSAKAIGRSEVAVSLLYLLALCL